ncbi:MAG: FHA domain-containing protein, partial [Eubacteriales bacterium]|nr:FHA domain-containing protein [Eubacteriales bacterium]
MIEHDPIGSRSDVRKSAEPVDFQRNSFRIWNFFLNYSAADCPLADPEQENKILRYPPPEILRSNWYLNKNVLTVQIYGENLKALCELDQAEKKKSDLGLERFLSIIKGCERLEEELLTVEPLFLHPALIYFSADAKILSLPFPPGLVSAASPLHQTANPWIFSAMNAEVSQDSSLAGLLRWIGKNYSISNDTINELLPFCQEENYRKLHLILSGQEEANESNALDLQDVGKNSPYSASEDTVDKRKAAWNELSENPAKRRKNVMNGSNTENSKAISSENSKKSKKSTGFFSGLRSRYSRDFQLSEKTADLVLEDPFFRMACLSEGLPGTKEEKLGHRAFILLDEFLIGRDSDIVDFWIDSQNVSRQHARIVRRQGSFFIEDLGSRNST